MDKYFVLIVGSGRTSRANIEALLEDHYYKNGKAGTLAVAYKTKPSPEQVQAIQFSKDKEKELLLFTTEDGRFDGAPSASVEICEDPVKGAVQFLTGLNSAVFILWSDEDPDCQNTLALCKEAGIPCFDLTEGLLPLTPSDTLKPIEAPQIPKQETLEYSSKEDDDDEEEEDDEEEDDEDEEEYEEVDDVYFAIEALSKLIAKEVAKEVVKALKNPEEGSQE